MLLQIGIIETCCMIGVGFGISFITSEEEVRRTTQ